MTKFKETPKRKPIDKAGLTAIYIRMFGAKCDELTKSEIEYRIKEFGRCECDDKGCKQPLAGYCEFDHKYIHAGSSEGDAIDWRALTKACHAIKTRKRDTPHAAKLKRTAAKYNPEYKDTAEPKKRTQWQSRGLKKPDGYKYKWPKRKMGQ